MNEYLERALEKLDKEYKSGAYDKCANIMKQAVRTTLEDFCRQDPEFAQAVVQGGNFSDCMKAVAKNCGSGLSDLDAYTRAVQFYFPGSKIRMQMSIDLIGDAAAPAPAATGTGGLILDFTQFL